MKRPVVFQGLFLNDLSRMAGLHLSGTQELYCGFLRPWEHVTIDIFEKFKPSAPGIMPQQFANGCIWFYLGRPRTMLENLKNPWRKRSGREKEERFWASLRLLNFAWSHILSFDSTHESNKISIQNLIASKGCYGSIQECLNYFMFASLILLPGCLDDTKKI